VTVATSLAILASVRFSGWNALLTGPTVQLLGRISYSLYLLHLAVGWRATVLTRELIGDSYSTATAYFAFGVGLAVSIIAAWIVNLLIERPAISLARKIRLSQRELKLGAGPALCVRPASGEDDQGSMLLPDEASKPNPKV
jgi:peptidoglycan/LPS O-acetylase OafA/YrhL